MHINLMDDTRDRGDDPVERGLVTEYSRDLAFDATTSHEERAKIARHAERLTADDSREERARITRYAEMLAADGNPTANDPFAWVDF